MSRHLVSKLINVPPNCTYNFSWGAVRRTAPSRNSYVQFGELHVRIFRRCRTAPINHCASATTALDVAPCQMLSANQDKSNQRVVPYQISVQYCVTTSKRSINILITYNRSMTFLPLCLKIAVTFACFQHAGTNEKTKPTSSFITNA